MPHRQAALSTGSCPVAADVLLEELLRDLHVDAGAVAGLAVGIDGAAMPQGLQRVRCRPPPPGAAALPSIAATKPDAASVMLVSAGS